MSQYVRGLVVEGAAGHAEARKVAMGGAGEENEEDAGIKCDQTSSG